MMQRKLATKLLSHAVTARKGQATRIPASLDPSLYCNVAVSSSRAQNGQALRALTVDASSSDSAPNRIAFCAVTAALAGAVSLTVDATHSEATPDKKPEKVVRFSEYVRANVVET